MIVFKHRGDFKKTENFLKAMRQQKIFNKLEYYAQKGVDALSAATPVDTGLTAASWSYEIEYTDTHVSIYWTNTNVNKGVNIAFILQYGHGTGTGGYVKGRDYINPAITPIFDEISENIWNEVANK